MLLLNQNLALIHRHTGGLENQAVFYYLGQTIHRHTGGLEIKLPYRFKHGEIHRHTGGLEK